MSFFAIFPPNPQANQKERSHENGGVEPTFNVDKITAFEVISRSAIKSVELQDVAADFPKSFPKLIDELIPSHFQEKEKDVVSAILNALTEPKSAKELASIASCSVRTIKEKIWTRCFKQE